MLFQNVIPQFLTVEPNVEEQSY